MQIILLRKPIRNKKNLNLRMDRLTKEQRKKNMQAVKNKNSRIELLLGKELRNRGLRYRKNDKTVPGKPDFCFKGLKIAVFCDSEFWHGKNWEVRKHDHKSNQDFWIAKIERNIERDRKVNEILAEAGWTILRFWGKDIIKDPDGCAETVLSEVIGKKSESKPQINIARHDF